MARQGEARQGTIERVARAIAPKAWVGEASLSQQNRRTASLRHARAAIEAMREARQGEVMKVYVILEITGEYSDRNKIPRLVYKNHDVAVAMMSRLEAISNHVVLGHDWLREQRFKGWTAAEQRRWLDEKIIPQARQFYAEVLKNPDDIDYEAHWELAEAELVDDASDV